MDCHALRKSDPFGNTYWGVRHFQTEELPAYLSLLKTNSKSTAVEFGDPDIAVIDRDDVGLVAIEAHLVSSRSEENSQDDVHLSPGKARVLALVIHHIARGL